VLILLSGDLISPTQTSFFPDRLASDNIFVVRVPFTLFGRVENVRKEGF